MDIKADKGKEGGRKNTPSRTIETLGNAVLSSPGDGPLQLGFLRRGL
jgi:hypothetical protein